MTRKVRARFTEGKIEPLEAVNLREGDELTITVGGDGKTAPAEENLARAAVGGGWKTRSI